MNTQQILIIVLVNVANALFMGGLVALARYRGRRAADRELNKYKQ